MNPLKLAYLKHMAQSSAAGRAYLQSWEKLSPDEKQTSFREHKEFWDELFSEASLEEEHSSKRDQVENCVKK